MVTILLALALGCSAAGPDRDDPSAGAPATDPGAVADVVGVTVTGSEGAYTFAPAIRSDETGCDQYADWWEVLTPDGELVYRRILNHSHPDEQPFTRDGGPVAVAADAEVLVRAHLHPSGFVGQMQRGTARSGFQAVSADPALFPALGRQDPLPQECWF